MADTWGGSWGSSWGFSWGGSAPEPVVVQGGGYGHRDERERKRHASRAELRSAVEAAFASLRGGDDPAVVAELVTIAPAHGRSAVIDFARTELALSGLQATLSGLDAALTAYEMSLAKALQDEEEAIVMLLLA